ncbi:MAG TPA: Do family serine endopeptidase [Bacteroidota bacterium]
MLKKPVLTSLVLLTAGIIIGAVIVSNLSGGIDTGFARTGESVRLGGPPPIQSPNPTVKALGDNFVAVAKAVTPSIVAVTVTSSGKGKGRNIPHDFWHNWGPDLQPPEDMPSQGFGSGVIVTPDGYIATNNHVVSDADADGIEIVIHDKIRYKAKLIGTDPTTDLAVVKIDAKDLPVAALGNSDNVQVGEWVLAIGNPLELNSTVTAGIISAMGRDIGIIQSNTRIENFIQTDAAINPGNSGGALVNMSGEVIGINSAIATTNARYQGYGFAVPVNLLKTVAADLIRNGKVRRGYIGVSIKEVDQTMADALGMNDAVGVMVQELTPGGSAEASGVQAGDVILSIDGKPVNAPNELQSYVAQRHPGDEVTLKLYRDGKTVERKVALKMRNEDQIAENAAPPEKPETETTTPSSKLLKLDIVGMSIRGLSAEEKKEFNLDKGAVVAEVKPYSEAFNRAIRPNDVIVEADRHEVNSPADLKKIFDSRKPGDAVLLRLKRDNNKQSAFVAVQIPK